MAKQPRRLIYQVAVGEVPAFYRDCIASVAKYCARRGIDHIVQTEPKLRIAPIDSKRSVNALRLGYLPIYEKENAFSHLDRYEEVAVVDADVYIRRHAPNIFGALGDACFAAAVERDLPLTREYAEKVKKHSEGQFRSLADVDWRWDPRGAHYYNMGLMVFNRGLAEYLQGETPEQFIRRPEFARFVNGEGHWKWSTDQTLLNWWVKCSGMKTRDLDWRWNALYGAVRPEMVKDAHFVHFFLSAKLPHGGAEIPQIIAGLT